MGARAKPLPASTAARLSPSRAALHLDNAQHLRARDNFTVGDRVIHIYAVAGARELARRGLRRSRECERSGETQRGGIGAGRGRARPSARKASKSSRKCGAPSTYVNAPLVLQVRYDLQMKLRGSAVSAAAAARRSAVALRGRRPAPRRARATNGEVRISRAPPPPPP